MERRTVARALTSVRRRRRWSQVQLAARLGISQSEMSRWECGALDSCSVAELDAWASALGAHLVLDLTIDGARPLTDARHAELQNSVAALLRSSGWTVEVEVSFNHYGDRGRIDVLAFLPGLGILLVIEIKTRLIDAQDLIGRLDVKRRIAPGLAAERGWAVRSIVPVIVMREGRTARRRLTDHAALFASFVLRGRQARAWLRRPELPAPTGIFTFMP